MRVSLLALLVAAPAFAAEPAKLSLLFLGDNAGHQPKTRFAILQPMLAARGIALTYTESLDDLNLPNLNKYDGLVIYANHTPGKPEQVKAIIDYVEAGKAFVPLHCASYCFNKNEDYIKLVGAQFRSHQAGTFRTTTVAADHPVMKGFQSFESWDETYVHHKHNETDRTVLETRAEKDLNEPWTWVRTQGKGRVFYTAWGHDARTFNHPGFQNLVERGIRWACGQDPQLAGGYFEAPKMTEVKGDKKDFEYETAKLPFYAPPASAGVQTDAPTKMQKPLPPEKSVTHASVPEGFEIKLFAADEMFQGGKPLCMTWDERGRLWVAVTTDYPNELQKPGEGRDKILVLEDTDGDGKADKVTVFADKLSIPTSLLCVHGGVLVHQAPHTLFLKDTDGDGKADLKEVLFSGWRTNDTHAGPSNLRYGFDNWIYGAVGYAGFNGEVGGEKVSFKQGYYRFKLENAHRTGLKVTKLEFLRSTSNNTWGFCFNEHGEMFGSTANGCALVHLPIPNRYYEKVPGLSAPVLHAINDSNRMHPITDRVRQVDFHGGFTAASNCAIYTARNYPPEYWNKVAFVSEPTGHLTATFTLQPKGTDYAARYGWNLFASKDEWTAPIDAQVGPDGNVWLLDWYNYIVQHNPTPKGFDTGKGAAYVTPLRDKTHGRIYRLVYKGDGRGRKADLQPNLKDATPAQLVETLKHDNMFWRQTAQRLLVERKTADGVDEPLVDIVNECKEDAAGMKPAQVHALWTLHGLGWMDDLAAVRPRLVSQILTPSLYHPSVRATALRMWEQTLPATKEGQAAHFNFLARGGALDAPVPGIQLATYLACGSLQPDTTQILPYRIWKGIRENGIDGDPNLRVAYTLAAAAQGVESLIYVVGNSKDVPPTPLTVSVAGKVAEDVARRGWTPRMNRLLKKIGKSEQPEMVAAIVNGFAAQWKGGAAELEPEGLEGFNTALKSVPAALRPKLLRLGTTWGVKGLDVQLAEIAKGLLAVALDAKGEDAARLDAARQLLEFQADDATAAQLLDSVTEKSSAGYAAGVLELLSTSKSKTLGAALVAKLPLLPPGVRPTALRAVLGRPESVLAFLDAVEKGTLRFDLLALDQKQALAAHPNKAVAERAKKLLALGGGLPDANRQKVVEEYAESAKTKGDAANGKKLFTTHCAKCHKHGTEGAQIGPDLTGFAVHPKEEILIAVMDPSRSVEGNFKAYTANMLDGRLVVGLLSSESKTSVELLDAENKRHALNRDDIDTLKESAKSLMPEGFEKQMKVAEMTDLLEFLTLKGKYVSLPLDKVASVVSTKDMFFAADGPQERLIFKDWTPKTFNGVPFHLVDPQGEKVKNVVLFNGPQGVVPPTMPKSVTLPCNTPAKAIHFLGGIGGWSATGPKANGTVSLIVRLNYADGQTEDHELKDGVHFADYIRRVDVPGSQFAFAVRGQQVRYLSVAPKRAEAIKTIDLVKGPDRTAPVVLAVTVETP